MILYLNWLIQLGYTLFNVSKWAQSKFPFKRHELICYWRVWLKDGKQIEAERRSITANICRI